MSATEPTTSPASSSTRISNFIADVRRGTHSNIPTCCVRWFSALGMNRIIQWNRSVDRDHPVHYVRCPICIVRDRREPLHICDRTLCGRKFIDLNV